MSDQRIRELERQAAQGDPQAGRYIWRGKLERIEDPWLVLSDAYQVIHHVADKVAEEQRVGPARVSMLAAESVYLASEALWVPK